MEAKTGDEKIQMKIKDSGRNVRSVPNTGSPRVVRGRLLDPVSRESRSPKGSHVCSRSPPEVGGTSQLAVPRTSAEMVKIGDKEHTANDWQWHIIASQAQRMNAVKFFPGAVVEGMTEIDNG